MGDIEIAFIPTVIYEAAFLDPTLVPESFDRRAAFERMDKARKVLFNILGIKDDWEGRMAIDQKALGVLQTVQDKDEQTQYLALLKYMYGLNKQKDIVEIAQNVNQKICATLIKDFDFIRTMNLKSAPPQKKMALSKLAKIKHFIVGSPRPSWNLSAAISKYFEEYDNAKASWNNLLNKYMDKGMMIHVAKLEVEAHHQNQAIIFRGSDQDSPLRLKDSNLYEQLQTSEMQKRENILQGKTPSISEKDVAPFSMCYGFSLMAGMAIESGGNAYNYTMMRGLGYALKIDKKLFFDRNRKSPRNLFWIPPFGTVVSLYGIDDLFHPRTTVGLTETLKGVKFDANDYVYKSGMKAGGKVDIELFYSFSPIMWVVGVDKDVTWDAKVAALVDYIPGHAVVFYDPANKLKEGRDILNTIHSDLLFLKEHQNKFASALGEIKNNPRALKDGTQKPAVLPRMAKPMLPAVIPGQRQNTPKPLPSRSLTPDEQKKQWELQRMRPKGPMVQPRNNPGSIPVG